MTTSQRTDGDPLVTDIQIDSIGNANQYVIDWGDGNVQTSNGPEDNHTVNHTFNTAGEGGIFTPTVTALNINGVGAGSSFTITSERQVILFILQTQFLHLNFTEHQPVVLHLHLVMIFM